jgi:hypothetical protein
MAPRIGKRMAGFVAIIANRSDRAVSSADVDALADSYRAIRGGIGELVVVGARIGAVAIPRMDGSGLEIHRRGESWALGVGAAHHPGSLVDAALDAIEGQFVLLRHDAEANTITLATDPFGMFALFVAERLGLTYVSTSALALARHLKLGASRLGLQTFLVAGYHCGTRTSWDGVERIGAGIRIDFGPDGRRRSRYWRPFVDHSIQRLGIAASVDRCLEAAVEAVRTAASRRELLWCDLTGGYDTRLLALLASRAGLSFITSTNGTGNEEDVHLARLIADVARWKWALLTLPQGWEQILPPRLPEALGWGDGALDAEQLAGVLWRHELKAKRTRGVLNGGGGEHYWSYAWQQEYGRSGRSGRANLDLWVRSRMLRAISVQVFARDPRREVVADLRARMEPVIEPYLHELRAVQADALYLHKSTGHFGAYVSAGASSVDLLLPFYTRASFTAAFSTNPRHRFGHRFYKRLIERVDPTIAAIPTAKGGPAQPLRLGNLAAFGPYYARLGEKGFNKAVQRLLGKSFRRPPGLDDESAARARAAFVAYVGPNIDHWRSRAMYNPARLSDMLAAAGRSDFRDSLLLSRILTAELSLRAVDAAVD